MTGQAALTPHGATPGAAPAPRIAAPTDWRGEAMRRRIARRYAAERRFRLMGLAAVLLSAGFLAFLLVTMVGNGARGFTRTQIALPIDFQRSAILIDPALLTGGNAEQALAGANLPPPSSTRQRRPPSERTAPA